jgi:hypothetical protein
MGTTPTKVIQTYVGDTSPDLTLNITREDGSIVDLTGATVAFILQNPQTGLSTNDVNHSLGITNLCEITNPTGGVCVYSWNLGHTDTPVTGYYKANLKIEFPNNTTETYGLTVVVEKDLIS